MALDETLDLYDAAMLLDGLADTVDLLKSRTPDPDGGVWRGQVSASCRRAAQLVAGASPRTDSYADARRYGGGEVSNLVALAVLGGDAAERMLLN